MCRNSINITKIWHIDAYIVSMYMIIWLYWSVNIRRRTSLLLNLLALLFKNWAGIDDRQWAHERQQRGKEVPTGCLHPRTQLVMESHALAMLMHLVTWSFWSGLDTQRPTWLHLLYRHLHVLISCLLRTHSSLRTLFRKFDSCVLRSPLHRIGNNDNLKTVELSPCAFSMCVQLRTRIIDNHRVEKCI